MEPVIEKILSTGSPLAVLVLVVYLFLRHLEKQGELNRTTYMQQGELNRTLFTSINEQSMQVRENMNRALIENAQNTRDNTVALKSVEIAVAKFKVI